MNRRLRQNPPKQTFAQRSGRSIRPMSLPPVLKIITPSLPALPPHPQHKLPSTSTRNGQWVGEITTAPARALSFSNPAILRPRKLQVLTTYTRELAEHSNIEGVVRQTLQEATASDPGDATKPPGLSRARRSRPRQAAVPMPCPATSATCSPRSRPTAAAKPL